MALATGSKLGPYEILSAAGAGGMGEVYRVRDTRLERTVAIKVLTEQFSQNPDLRQRFEREAKAISSLNHPNICTLYDVGHQDGTDYLVMEYIEGESLAVQSPVRLRRQRRRPALPGELPGRRRLPAHHAGGELEGGDEEMSFQFLVSSF